MHIDSYQFGQIVIDGTSYNSDLIIINDTVQANWWRQQGHLLSPKDMESVIAARPSSVIIGCGESALMVVSNETRQVFKENDIQLEAMNTPKAVRRFNELSKQGQNVAAAFHLSC